MDRRLQYILFVVWVLALASTPLWGSNYVVRLAVVIAMYTALALSWNFIGGFAGYPSFSTPRSLVLAAMSARCRSGPACRWWSPGASRCS